MVAVAVAGCRCRVPLQGAVVRVLFALWSLVAGALQGAAAGCCGRVPLLVLLRWQASPDAVQGGGLVCL